MVGLENSNVTVFPTQPRTLSLCLFCPPCLFVPPSPPPPPIMPKFLGSHVIRAHNLNSTTFSITIEKRAKRNMCSFSRIHLFVHSFSLSLNISRNLFIRISAWDVLCTSKSYFVERFLMNIVRYSNKMWNKYQFFSLFEQWQWFFCKCFDKFVFSYDQQADKWDSCKHPFGLKSGSNYLINLLRVFSRPSISWQVNCSVTHFQRMPNEMLDGNYTHFILIKCLKFQRVV